jgi:hypothetical protein
MGEITKFETTEHFWNEDQRIQWDKAEIID